MATRSTQYLVGERRTEGTGRQERVRWTWVIVAAPSADPYAARWFWTGDRPRATRFTGRKDAQAFADAAMSEMKANGHSVRLYVVPASGGVPVGAPYFG